MKVNKIQIAKNKRHGEVNIIINEKYAYLFSFISKEHAAKKIKNLPKEIDDRYIYEIYDSHKRDLEII